MYDTILIPTDGSENAERASMKATEIADQYEATMHALYVMEETRDEPTRKTPEEKFSEEKRTGSRAVEVVEDHGEDHGIAVETVIERGVPRTEIETHVDENNIDLIVIGSTGADSVKEKFLGSVSKYIVNEAPADVLVVRPDAALA